MKPASEWRKDMNKVLTASHIEDMIEAIRDEMREECIQIAERLEVKKGLLVHLGDLKYAIKNAGKE